MSGERVGGRRASDWRLDTPTEALLKQLEAERSRLETVLLRLPEILGELEVERLVEGLAEAARELTGADFAMYVGAQEADLQVLVGAAERDFQHPPAPVRAPLLAAAFSSRAPLRVDDTLLWALSEEAARPYGSFRERGPVRSYMAAPVVIRSGEVLGALFLGHHQQRAFDRRDEQLLLGISAHLAVALEKADVLAERAEVARVLQETLLPPLLPVIRGVDCAARYRPTGSGNLVGGDFYDVFSTGHGEWGVVLGDVSGVGAEAAALTGIARYTVRAVAGDGGPSAVLRSLNDALNNQRTGDRFCTAVFLRLVPTALGVAVTLANAGHPPPLVLREDGHVESAGVSGGMPLGLFPDACISDQVLTLSPGDAIVLYTDGVIEARAPDGLEFGQERLESLLVGCAGRTADGIARRLELAVIDHQAGSTLDDVAVLVVRAATPSPPRG
ncbi:MAG: SpoIIE family protein phosphatase [Actinobacteria bacterium]|nr:SpoIIE family protein phosphatase [Actinomycetota bacterium]MBW3649124.1 SpoIIE family protein phosphatase [Actinomycetota bacterium]